MKSSRRMDRMARNRSKVVRMNLTSLMDVFTILVFFLLVNSAASEVVDSPKQLVLPESVAEARPRETVVIFVSPEYVLVQGQPVMSTADLVGMETERIEAIGARLAELRGNVIGIRTQAAAESEEVTVLADKSIPFSVLKKVMSTCTSEGYGRISLAVVQKATQTTQI
jgi:biopolymer transport protein ExbD